MELEAFELVFLRRPAQPTAHDEATLQRIQREHLAFYDDLRSRGIVVTNGPVLNQPDESLRGLAFYRTGSLDEARRIAEQDPAYLAGRFELEVMTWWCPPATMAQPGQALSIEPT